MLDYQNTKVGDEFLFEDSNTSTSFSGKIIELSYDITGGSEDDGFDLDNLHCIVEIDVSKSNTYNSISLCDVFYSYDILDYNNVILPGDVWNDDDLPETLKWDITKINLWLFDDPTIELNVYNGSVSSL